MHRRYETLLLFQPDLTSEERQRVLDVLYKVIQDHSGQVAAQDNWGMKELAYPVDKHTRGYYIRLEYGAPGEAVYELERRIRISEGVLKFLTVKLADEFQPAEEEA
jgi:small subunit ribosomal protein S6